MAPPPSQSRACERWSLLASLLALAGCLELEPAGRPAALSALEATVAGGEEAPAPVPFRSRGQLVCLAEEMRRLHGAGVAPVHEHIPAFRVAPGGPAATGAPGVPGETSGAAPGPRDARYYTLLPTPGSRALLADPRFQGETLLLTGRVFPEAGALEVSGFARLRQGKVYDVHYWCDTCAIRSLDPGPCPCCQGEVVLREELRLDPGGPRDPPPPRSSAGAGGTRPAPPKRRRRTAPRRGRILLCRPAPAGYKDPRGRTRKNGCP